MASPHATFLFADMAGFTALTEAHGDEHAADIAGTFSRRVEELLGDDGAVLKVFGDAVMVRCPEARRAVAAGLRIALDFGGEHGALPVRVGMHTGPAVERDGDWFGATVNLAARVAAVASGGEVLLTNATAEAAGELAGVDLHRHGVHSLRNVSEPVLLLRAVAHGHDDTDPEVDPVCRMVVDPGQAAGVLEHEGRPYRFCSLDCVARFASDPGRYTRPARERGGTVEPVAAPRGSGGGPG